MDHTDKITMSYSPAASRLDDKEYTEDWQIALIRRIYPFWVEKNINLKRSELKYPFDGENSLFNHRRELYFDRPWLSLAKVKNPAEEIKKQNLKIEREFRKAIDGLGEGRGWRVSVKRKEIVEGLRGRVRDGGSGKEAMEEGEKEEVRRHDGALRGLLREAVDGRGGW